MVWRVSLEQPQDSLFQTMDRDSVEKLLYISLEKCDKSILMAGVRCQQSALGVVMYGLMSAMVVICAVMF